MGFLNSDTTLSNKIHTHPHRLINPLQFGKQVIFEAMKQKPKRFLLFVLDGRLSGDRKDKSQDLLQISVTWKDPQKWEKMRSGEKCPMCSDIPLPENKYGFLVKELERSYVRLQKNQHYYGWVIVFLKRHAIELYELEDEERNEYMKEVSRVTEAVSKVFGAVKMHCLSFGSLCPHLHFHIIPRQIEDDPHHAIKMDEAEKFLSTEEYKDIIERLRSAIG